jgi:hypothetical protein
MSTSLCLDAVPFLNDITAAIKQYGETHNLEVQSLYHDEPLWIIVEREQENIPVQGVQIFLDLEQGKFMLSFIPYYYIARGGKRVSPNHIPPRYITHTEVNESQLNEIISTHLDDAFAKATLIVSESPV